MADLIECFELKERVNEIGSYSGLTLIVWLFGTFTVFLSILERDNISRLGFQKFPNISQKSWHVSKNPGKFMETLQP